MPRGRTYVRNGSVVDLQITPGAIEAYVSGSELYKVAVKVAPVKTTHWKSICEDCAGGIDSLVELLQGRLSKGVMERICRQKIGLFPTPAEIQLSCSCPDWADMCKHVAAVLYGIGARFDRQPELLFRLRGVDEMELIANVGKATPLAKQGPAAGKVLGGDDLAEMFGLDMAQGISPDTVVAKGKQAKRAKKVVTEPKPAKRAKQTAAPKGKTKPKKKPASKQGRKRAGLNSSN